LSVSVKGKRLLSINGLGRIGKLTFLEGVGEKVIGSAPFKIKDNSFKTPDNILNMIYILMWTCRGKQVINHLLLYYISLKAWRESLTAGEI
jgi:hypothetical protein